MNLLKDDINTICGNCRSKSGECPDCGTFWRGGFGYRIEWAPEGKDLFIKNVNQLMSDLNLPPGTIQVYQLTP